MKTQKSKRCTLTRLVDQMGEVRKSQEALQALAYLTRPNGANDDLAMPIDREQTGLLIDVLSKHMDKEITLAEQIAQEARRSKAQATL